MDARVTGWTIAVVVVATFGFVAMFAIEAEVSSRDLGKAQTSRSEAKDELEKTRSAIERAQERVKQATKFAVEKDKLSTEIAGIQKTINSGVEKVAAETTSWNAERDAFERTLNAVRKATVGSKIPGVTLSGVVHDNVTVTAVTKGLVSIETGSGFQKLPTAKLPADLAEKLKPDWNPVLSVTESLLPKELPKTAAKSQEPERDMRYPDDERRPAPAATPAPAPAVARSSIPKDNPVSAEIAKHRAAMDTLAGNMRAAEVTLNERRATCARLENDFNSAKLQGKIVSVSQELMLARKSVETILAQFETARRQYVAMEAKLNELNRKEADWYKTNQ